MLGYGVCRRKRSYRQLTVAFLSNLLGIYDNLVHFGYGYGQMLGLGGL
jgi:hypothetical protein